MKLGEYLDKDLVLPALTSKNKAEVLAEMVGPLAVKFEGLDMDDARRVLMERERLGTTGIGEGVAIPHGKLASIEKIIVVVGRSPEGIDFEALDFKPCHIFFLVLAPEQVAGLHLRILAHISRLLKDENFKKEFLAADGLDAVWDLLQKV